MVRFMRLAGLALSLGTFVLAAPATAQSVADFYKGKSVFLVVGSGPAGGYDVYTRALARYWSRHIPGNPNLVVQNMPGAGGITMMNYIAHIAKPDGTYIGAAFANTVIEPVFDKGKVTKYDSRQMNWIGSISPQSIGCFTWGTNKITTLEEAQQTPVIMATTGNSISAMSANIVNTMLGTKFKIVMGYTTAESTLAVERGEAEGTCLSSATILAAHPDWIKDHKLNWLIVLANRPDPILPGTPIASNYVKTDEDKQVLNLIVSQLAMGRPDVLPPDTPADRVEALRTSFMETMNDPDFLAEAQKLYMIVDPSDHVEMEKMINYTYSIPDNIVTKAKNLIDAVPAGSEAPKQQ